MRPRRIGLISCVSKKDTAPQPAQALYTSDLFKKSLAFARLHCDVVYILSAKYGLLEQTEVIAPYEQTLKKMSREARRRWAGRVMRQLGQRITVDDEVLLLCGMAYREFLEEWLPNKICCPIRGLGIGQQLAFYKHALRKENRDG